MPSISAPATQSAVESTTGYTAVIRRQRILSALAERASVLNLGLASIYGDVVGSGSDTVKITHVDGIGFDESFTAMSHETDAIVATGFSVDADTMSIGRYGLGKQMTYTLQGVDAGRDEAVTWDKLIEAIPESWLRTLMDLVCATGATFSTAVGSTGAAWDLDKELALVAAFNAIEGADEGGIVTVRHPKQYTDLQASLRAEGFLYQSADFQAQQSLAAGMGRPGGQLDNWLGLDNYRTFRVDNDGTDHQGFAYQRGAIGWVRCSTSPIRVKNPATALYVDEAGLLIEQDADTDQSTSKLVAVSLVGAGKLSASVRAQRRMISAI